MTSSFSLWKELHLCDSLWRRRNACTYHLLNQNRKMFFSQPNLMNFNYQEPLAELPSIQPTPDWGSSPPYCRFHPQCTRKEGSFSPRKLHLNALSQSSRWNSSFRVLLWFFFSNRESNLVWSHQLSNPKRQRSHNLITT